MTEPIGRPAYQQVADDLSLRIASGEYPVGSVIPSTTRLTEMFGVSSTVVRAAVSLLRTGGVLVGQPGKGVFVSATPDIAAGRAATIGDLARQLEEVRAELRRAESARTDEVAAVRRDVDLLRTQLTDLYVQLGRPVPADGLAASD